MPFLLSERLAVLEPGCAVNRAPSQQTFTAPGSSTESLGHCVTGGVCVCVCARVCVCVCVTPVAKDIL